MKTHIESLISLLVVALAVSAMTARAQSPTDFGDAPAPYPTTLKDNGARHSVTSGIFLGALVDGEGDGQPAALAFGDDNVGNADDEDGVVFVGLVSPGETATVRVTASAAGFLNAWLDFNANGSWAETADQICIDTTLLPGATLLTFNVPAASKTGVTYARFRFSTIKGLSLTGAADNGEVEDHALNIVVPQDFGDAPASYKTLLADGGAHHTIEAGFSLGKLVDGEIDGQPTPPGRGDDVNPLTGEDEDGVKFTSELAAGKTATVEVFCTMSPNHTGKLNAWFDFNTNGTWEDVGEQIFSEVVVKAGLNTLTFNIPANAASGVTYARFRLNHEGMIKFGGSARNGEVEDYQVSVQGMLDYGDAPAPYPTLLKDNGARHIFSPIFKESIQLGSLIDVETDGQPDYSAQGDDQTPAGGRDDEDGVMFNSPIIPGRPSSVTVSTISNRAYLNAWIDFNGNGSWADKGDQICTAFFLNIGTTEIPFNVPSTSKQGLTYARFRISSQPELSFTGEAKDGEVEDYQVSIRSNRERCDLDCEGHDFWIAFPGNYSPDPDNQPKLSVNITGPAGVTGKVEIPGVGFSEDFLIPASRCINVALPKEAHLGNLNDEISKTGVHITASSDVSVTGYNHVHYSTDSFLALHTDVLGVEYIVMGYGNLHTGVPPLNGTQFAIIGTDTNTLVTITPSVATLGHPAGAPYSITLQPGECYQLRNTNDAPSDLSGTIITSDKPVGVYGGHQCANIPTADLWFCDFIVEQLLPVNTWGMEFLPAPLATRGGGITIRCLAAYDGTSVSLNNVPAFTLDRGQFKELRLPVAVFLTSDKPVFVAQYANSSDSDGVVKSDPFMTTVQALRHYVNRYLVCTPPADFADNYLWITTPNAGIGTLQIDGVVVPAASFTSHVGTSFSYAPVPVSVGTHLVTGSVNFGLSQYGWSEYESYGHPACFFFGDVVAPQVTPPVPSITVAVGQGTQVQTPGYAAVPNVAANSQGRDNCDREPRSLEQTPKPGTLLAPGIHNLTVSVADSSRNIGKANVQFIVLDPSPVVIECLNDIVTDCTTTEGAVVKFDVKAHSTYDPTVPVVCNPASGTVFPVGVTTVICTAKSLAGEVDSCSFTVTVNCQGRITGENGPFGLVLNWTGSPGALERSADPSGPWSQVTTGVNRYKVRPGASQEYFRVRY